MQRKYIPAITMLTAGAVTCIVSIANNLDKLLSLEILLGVLIVFYIIGWIAKTIISRVLDSGNIPEVSEEDSPDTPEEDGFEIEDGEGIIEDEISQMEGNEETKS